MKIPQKKIMIHKVLPRAIAELIIRLKVKNSSKSFLWKFYFCG